MPLRAAEERLPRRRRQQGGSHGLPLLFFVGWSPRACRKAAAVRELTGTSQTILPGFINNDILSHLQEGGKMIYY